MKEKENIQHTANLAFMAEKYNSINSENKNNKSQQAGPPK